MDADWCLRSDGGTNSHLQAINIIQPDCSHAGGISLMLTIARLAEAYEVSFAPHW